MENQNINNNLDNIDSDTNTTVNNDFDSNTSIATNNINNIDDDTNNNINNNNYVTNDNDSIANHNILYKNNISNDNTDTKVTSTTAVTNSKTCCKTNKKQNFLVRLWNYYSTYEKIWLFLICSVGITLGILFPEEEVWWVQLFAMITLVGGCSCELLLSKQSKWAFIVSFFFYDITQIVTYVANGYYISAVFEVIFWCPMLFISFFSWDKKKDKDDLNLTQVKSINYKKEIIMFIVVLCISVATGFLFTFASSWFPNFGLSELSDYWYIDALANTFSVCNGLFLWLRYREQWIAWLGVTACESVMWIISKNWVMLILQVGYLTNTIYGMVQWNKYIKKHKTDVINKTSN